MKRKTKSINLNILIKILQNVQREDGNLKVFMSSDTEGNSFNSIEESGEGLLAIDKKILILYPWEDNLELSDI
jgi:hypothetical protein